MIHKGKTMIQISEAKEIKALIYGVLEDFFQQSSIRSHILSPNLIRPFNNQVRQSDFYNVTLSHQSTLQFYQRKLHMVFYILILFWVCD